MNQALSIFNLPQAGGVAGIGAPPPALTVTGVLPNHLLGEAYTGRLQINNPVGKCTATIVSSDLPVGSAVYVDNFLKEVVVDWPAYSAVSTSVVPNGTFEQGATAWTLTGPWKITNTGDSESGVWSAEFGKGANGTFKMVGGAIPVSPATPVSVQARVQQGGSSANNAGAGVGLRWLDANYSVVSEGVGAKVVSNNSGSWSTATHIDTAPAGAAFVAPLVEGFRSRENKALWVDDVEWSLAYFAGANTETTYNLSLSVQDSAGRVAYWSGTILSQPLTNPIAESIWAKLTEWWELSGDQAIVSPYNKHVAKIHATNSPRAVNTETFPERVGVRGGADTAAQCPAYRLIESVIDDIAYTGAHQQMTVFGWYYAASHSGNQVLMTRWNQNNASTLHLYLSLEGTNMRFTVGGNAYHEVRVAAPAAGAWHFIVAWVSADKYLNMEFDNSGIVHRSASAMTGTLTPGTDRQGSFGMAVNAQLSLTGGLSRWGWVQGANLTSAEKTYLYNAGLSRKWEEFAVDAGI